MKRILILIAILALLKLFIQVIQHYVILSEDVYFATYEEIYSIEELDSIIKKAKDSLPINYSIFLVAILLRACLVSMALYAGIYLADIRGTLYDTFCVALKTEIVFCIKPLLTIMYFLVVKSSYTITDFYTFNPLSLRSIIGVPEGNFPELKFILNICSVFLLLYFFILAIELARTVNVSFPRALKVTIASYGPLYAIWATFIMFLLTSLK